MTCPTCTPARVHLSYSSETPSGVTIKDSLFDGGNADGIQTGVGVNIIGNEFRNIHETGPGRPCRTATRYSSSVLRTRSSVATTSTTARTGSSPTTASKKP